MKITYYGHGSLLIDWSGTKLMVDPFISGSPLPAAQAVDVDSIQADYVLLTHGHGDHIIDAVKIIQNNDAFLISNYEIVTHYGEQNGIKGHPLNHGGKYTFDFGTVKYVNAVHSSSFPDGKFAGNPGGFVIWNDQECLYIAGDTALTLDMKLIPMTCPKLDLAVMPIGDNFTMGYEDACIASDFVECNKILGYHYDTFPPIEIDHNKASKHFSKAKKELILPEIGKTYEF